jgi:hypothetical protein
MTARARTEEQLWARIAELEANELAREEHTARLERQLEELGQAKQFQIAVLEQCRVDRAQEQSAHQETLKQLQDVIQILTEVQQRAELQCPVVATATASTLRTAQILVSTVRSELKNCHQLKDQLEKSLERAAVQVQLPVERKGPRPRRLAVTQ